MSKEICEQYFEEELEVLAILKKGWFSTAYNPKINCHHITFDIYDEEDFKKVDKWLHPARYESEGKDNAKS